MILTFFVRSESDRANPSLILWIMDVTIKLDKYNEV